MEQAGMFTSLNLTSYGYEYLVVDDCWMAKERVDGHLVAEKNYFPSGMKALGDLLHSANLKFGLY